MGAQQSSVFRDIKEFPSDSGFPPFAPSGLFLIVLLVVIYLVRMKGAVLHPPMEKCRNADSVETLITDLRSGAMDAESLFIRISELLQYRLCGSCGRLTSEELLKQLSDTVLLDAAVQAEVRGVMMLCDRVKFGRHRPTFAETELCLLKVEAILTTAGKEP